MREPNSELAPQPLLLCRLALVQVVYFFGSLVFQLNRFVRGLVAQIARLIFHLVEGGLFAGLELRRLHKRLLAECNDDDALAVLADIESKCTKRNAHALLAHAQETADAENDAVDATFAIENEIIDVADGLTSSIVHGLADKHSREPLVGCLLGDERHGGAGRVRRLG